MSLWTARNVIQEKLRDVPELLPARYQRLHHIAFDLALALYEAKSLRDQPLTRWQHFKCFIGLDLP